LKILALVGDNINSGEKNGNTLIISIFNSVAGVPRAQKWNACAASSSHKKHCAIGDNTNGGRENANVVTPDYQLFTL